MKALLEFLTTLPTIRTLHRHVRQNAQNILLNNVNENVATILVKLLENTHHKPIVVVAPNLYRAQKFYDKLVQVVGHDDVYFFPMDEFISAEMLASSHEFRQERLNTLQHLVVKNTGIVVTHTIGAIRKLPPKGVFQDYIIHLTVGDEIDYDRFIEQAVAMGYTRAEIVENPGEMAVRGGIIDIFPYTVDRPYRLEFFGDEIDSIRIFDEFDQRTIEKCEEALIPPIFELVYDDDVKERAIQALKDEFEDKTKSIKGPIKRELEDRFQEELFQIDNHEELVRLHKYIDYFYDETETIFDYIPESFVFWLEYHQVLSHFDNFVKEYEQFNEDLIESNKTVFIPQHYETLHQLFAYPNQHLFVQEFTTPTNIDQFEAVINFSSRDIERYDGNLDDLFREFRQNKGIKTYCICFDKSDARQHFSDQLTEESISHALVGESDKLIINGVNLIVGPLSEGFELVEERLKIITPFELYRKKTPRPVKYRSTKLKHAKKIKDIKELNVGDYVVHYDHGVGQYLGIKTLTTSGVQKDFVELAYRGGDKLYVPVEKINMVQKYVGKEGTVPTLHKIGGVQWKKQKQRVRQHVKDIAQKLLKLYMEREKAQGFAFSPDTDLQREFEAEFQYVETPDQLIATREIKEDMERPIPMDRLLCGDVGYGKTEVAMRAAFKAIMDNKQVAYLAPTTILTQQHYETFTERFRNYPVNIALLNRFVPPKTQKQTIDRLKKGQIDIIIGTHRLLSKDVEFYDLGLLIIDEEQRFGVEHKEKIKELKINVDVLTLTATPIPRTLQMALVGVRSLSLLDTPPENRYPVQTYVVEENDTIIKEAIERELAREGQVFYLYNRIEGIERQVEKIRQLVPEARVTYAHGQMSREELEQTMHQFMNKEYDVLVCTTIIETGIDIANANTLIISNADRLGLSQLYQLRGRVGRSDRIAYAYMMYPKRKVLTEVATKRLKAIKEFTELGSGFKIAKQDLAIRGAGDLLGPQQYGFIDTVGFELYTQMLETAIKESRQDMVEAEEFFKDTEQGIDIRILQDAYIPSDYISDEGLKIDIYKKIKLINSHDDLIDLQNELIDRFSDFPEPVENLLNLAYIKSVCLDLGIEKIHETKNHVEFQFSVDASRHIDGEFYFMVASELSRNINFRYIHQQFIIMVDKPRLKENYLRLMTRFFVKITQSRNM